MCVFLSPNRNVRARASLHFVCVRLSLSPKNEGGRFPAPGQLLA